MSSELQRWYRQGVPDTNPEPASIDDDDWRMFVLHVNHGISIGSLSREAGISVNAMRSRLLRVVRSWNHRLAQQGRRFP